MVELVHSVPGRLRIRISRMRRDPHIADAARATILSIPAVTGVAANTVTGSLVITYHPGALSPAALWDEVRCRLSCCASAATEAAMPASGLETLPSPSAGWIDQAARAALDALIGRVIQHAATALVRVVI
jgi:Heavy metal associated domain 2